MIVLACLFSCFDVKSPEHLPPCDRQITSNCYEIEPVKPCAQDEFSHCTDR